MGLKRMDNVGIVVDDMAAAIGFFTELGMELEGAGEVSGEWASTAVGVKDLRCKIAMLRTPDGQGRLELSQYLSPALVDALPENPPHNIRGMHRVMFTVDDLDDTIDRLRKHGGELVDGIGEYEDSIRICYLRGPAGTLVGLAEYVR